MEETVENNESAGEEKELSFSISRILQSNCSVKKVDIGYQEATKCRCNAATQGCECSNIPQIRKINGERVQDSVMPYPWQMLNKQTNRRIGHPYQSRAAPKRKKPRTTFSRAQITELEDLFTEKKYLTSSERQKVADYLNLSDCQVKTWFQNRRTKWKRETEEEKEEQRHAMTRTMMTLQKERMIPFQEFHRVTCKSSRT